MARPERESEDPFEPGSALGSRRGQHRGSVWIAGLRRSGPPGGWAAARDARNRPALAARKPVPIAPSWATALLAASAGCGTLKDWTQPTPAPVVKAYADGSRAPERMEQFYNPRTGNLVYRFGVGDECPGPTPKKPARTMSVVTEVHPDGMGTGAPEPQGVTSAAPAHLRPAGKRTREAARRWPPSRNPARPRHRWSLNWSQSAGPCRQMPPASANQTERELRTRWSFP